MIELIKKLKAPRGQYNSFGKYKYRSCEDILEAVKPLLAEHNAILNLSDEVVCVGTANYIKATATLYMGENVYEAHGWAREDFDKKGMDAPQMTGTASSYARKYALNGLFCIDDTKDADTNEFREERTARQQTATTTQPKQAQQPKRSTLTLEQAKESEIGFMSWLYTKYQSDKALDVTKVVTEFYECDYATQCWLRDQFVKYVKQMEKE